MDRLSVDRRSWLMSRVRSKNTTPELKVRKLIYSMGFRYRLHRSDMPGKPDLVFSGLRKVIFVHGCFWHRHTKCRKATVPKSNVAFWSAKFASNVERDRKNFRILKRQGWDILVIWQCQTMDTSKLEKKLWDYLHD